MKRFFLILLLCLLPSFAYGAVQFFGQTCDPSGSCNGQGGFSRLHFISSIKQFLNPFGPGPQQGNDVSMRTYDALTGVWTYVRPNNWAGGSCLPNCLPSRDNHVSFYVPAIDEFWVTGGSHIVEAFPPNQQYFAGRLSFAGCQPTVTAGCASWLATSLSYDAAFSGVIRNSMWGTAAFGNPANAWNASADMGMSFGGNAGGNPTPRHFIVERNIGGGVCGTGYGGSERYIMCELPNDPKDRTPTCGVNNPSGTTPGRRHQATNILVAGDTDRFYLFAGWLCDVAGVHYNSGDMWRWDRSQAIATGNGWTEMAAPPIGGVNYYQATCFYDSNRNQVVCRGEGQVIAYSVANNTWADVTPSGGIDNIFNTMGGAYDPRADLSMQIGGVYAATGAGYNVTTAIYPAGNFYMPIRTWVARSYSNMVPNGAGRYPPFNGGGNAGGKHMTSAVNPNTGKIYFFGGDSHGSQYALNQQGTWSYHIPSNTWTEEYPMCGLAGDVQPGGPDELGVVWDSTRNKFWTMPGFYFLIQSGTGACGAVTTWTTASPITITGKNYYAVNLSTGDRWFQGSGFNVSASGSGSGYQETLTINSGFPGSNGGAWPATITLRYALNSEAYQSVQDQTFNPVTNKYTNAGVNTFQGSLASFNAAYDPTNDNIWRMGPDVSGNTSLHKYNIATNTRTQYPQICLSGGSPSDPWYNMNGCGGGTVFFNNVDMHKEWLTIDVVGRKLYALDASYYRLLQSDLDSPGFVIKAYPPATILSTSFCMGQPVFLPNLSPQNSCTDFTHPHFDTANNVLLFPSIRNHNDSRPKLGIYHPDTDSWEVDAMFQPQGLTVRGNHSVYDSVNNVLMVIGGLCAGDAGVCQGGSGPGDGNVDPNLAYFFLYRYGASVGDTTPPVATITSPTSSPTYDTASATVTISGTASDDTAVTQVSWSNSRGGSGIAAGTTSWSVSNIALQSGQNVLTVTASDAAGNTGNDILTVNFTTGGDAVSPVLTITTPTSSPTTTTTQTLIDLAGTSSDNIGVTSITWVNAAGGSGTASFTPGTAPTWSIFNIPLVLGSGNVITVTAQDNAGNVGTDVITVTRDAPPPSAACVTKLGKSVAIGNNKSIAIGQCG